MNVVRVTLWCVVALMLALASPAQASTTIERTNLREYAAFAEWVYKDSQGNDIFASVVVSEIAHKNASSVPIRTLVVSIFAVDPEGFVTFAGIGFTETFDFTVAPHLREARLSATLPIVDDNTGILHTLTTDILYTSTAPPVTYHSSSHEHNGVVSHTVFNGQMRAAQAVGTVIVDGVNYTQIPTASAVIARNQNGQFSITLP